MRRIAFLFVVALTGCSALKEPGERAWLAAHAIDTAQTLTFRDDPCIREGNSTTAAIIGREPKPAAVAAWSIATAAAHMAFTEFLLDRGYERTARAWQWVTFTEKGINVARNHELGARIFGENVQACRQNP
jgi:hypothetical protein